jgi:hypothetical protein
LFATATVALSKTEADANGQVEAQLLLQASWLGILANKRDRGDIANNFATSMREFEVKYRERYLEMLPPGLPADFDIHTHNLPFLPHPDEPLRTLRYWQARFDQERLNGARFGPAGMMYDRITEDDIAAFSAKVWPNAQD